MQGRIEQERTRVSDKAERIEHGHDGDYWLWVTYDLGGWVVTLRSRANAKFDGPEQVQVRLDESDEGVDAALEMASESGGVTAEVLRSLPLGDARKVLRRLRAEVLATRDKDTYELPERMQSLHDWARFARAYVRSEARNPSQPVVHLTMATGLSRNTITARTRRAQELGLLERSGSTEAGDPWLLLTVTAKEILKDGNNG